MATILEWMAANVFWAIPEGGDKLDGISLQDGLVGRQRGLELWQDLRANNTVHQEGELRSATEVRSRVLQPMECLQSYNNTVHHEGELRSATEVRSRVLQLMESLQSYNNTVHHEGELRSATEVCSRVLQLMECRNDTVRQEEKLASAINRSTLNQEGRLYKCVTRAL
eukprot:1161619-Pelagomonas_calceolata.AAC.1